MMHSSSAGYVLATETMTKIDLSPFAFRFEFYCLLRVSSSHSDPKHLSGLTEMTDSYLFTARQVGIYPSASSMSALIANCPVQQDLDKPTQVNNDCVYDCVFVFWNFYFSRVDESKCQCKGETKNDEIVVRNMEKSTVEHLTSVGR